MKNLRKSTSGFADDLERFVGLGQDGLVLVGATVQTDRIVITATDTEFHDQLQCH